MEIPFRSQFDSMHWAFVMTFEPQHIAAVYDGDISRINIQAMFKRAAPSDNQLQDLYPVILELHGRLYKANSSSDLGAALLPMPSRKLCKGKVVREHLQS